MTAAAETSIADGLALVETVASFGSHRISFDRDPSDSFAVTVSPLTPGGAHVQIGKEVGKDLGKDVRKDDLLPLLPRGSGWNVALGWRSFVVLPFELPGICAAAVGMEGVVPHASRGAFPIMRAFLMRADAVSPALARLAAGLSAGRSDLTASLAAGLPDQRCVVWSSDARSPLEHERHEAPMILATAEAWASGERKLLRTVVLSDDQAPWPGSWTEKLREVAHGDEKRCYLVATVPAIRAHFSRSTRLTLLWKELLE